MVNKFSVFNGAILEWALQRAGLDAGNLGHKEETVKKWLSGEDFPTVKQAEELAKKLDIPLPYFCLTDIPDEDLPLPDFRTEGNKPIKRLSLGLRKTIEHSQLCQNFLREYLEESEAIPFAFKGRLKLSMSPEEGAKEIEDILGKPETKKSPGELFVLLAREIEKKGVLVQKNRQVLNSTTQKLETKEFRGYAIFDEYAPLIFINENDAAQANVFSLIHEFCHILLSSSGISGLEETNSKEEMFCDKVAAEYLVPKTDFLKMWESQETSKPDIIIGALAKHFGVSKWVILRKARQLHCITNDFYETRLHSLLSYIPEKRNTGKGGPNYNVVQKSHFGERLINSAVIAAYSGMITFTEAMGLTKLSISGIEQKAKELRL